MKAWTSLKTRQRQLEWNQLVRNPLPGLDRTQRQRIARSLEKIKGSILYWLAETDQEPMKGWLPYQDIITRDDDSRMQDYYMAYSSQGEVDDDGYLLAMHDPGIKATNRITAVTWYLGKNDRQFLLCKYIYSPLPSEQWGTLPLTLHNWRYIALSLIASRALWQWVHAVREYLDDDSFEYRGCIGWHMEPTVRSQDSSEGVENWTAKTILQPIISQFSLD